VLRNSPNPGLEIEVWAVTSWRGEIINAAPTEHDKIGWFNQAEFQQLDLADPDVATACITALHILG